MGLTKQSICFGKKLVFLTSSHGNESIFDFQIAGKWLERPIQMSYGLVGYRSSYGYIPKLPDNINNILINLTIFVI